MSDSAFDLLESGTIHLNIHDNDDDNMDGLGGDWLAPGELYHHHTQEAPTMKEPDTITTILTNDDCDLLHQLLFPDTTTTGTKR